MVADPEFLAEAETLRAEVRPVSGAALTQLLGEVYATEPELVERARALLR